MPRCFWGELINYLQPPSSQPFEEIIVEKINELNKAVTSFYSASVDRQKSANLIATEIKKIVSQIKGLREDQSKGDNLIAIELKNTAEKLDALIKEIRECCNDVPSSQMQQPHLEKTFSTLQSFASLLRLYQAKESLSQMAFSNDDREFVEKSFSQVLEAVEKIEVHGTEEHNAENTMQLEREIQILVKILQDLLDSQGYRPDFSCANCGNTVVPKNALYCPSCAKEID